MAAHALRLVPNLDREVPPPTWGEDFQRIRKNHYKNATILLDELEELGVDSSTATISRLEALTAPPIGGKLEITAIVTLILCNVHPATLGLGIDALPGKVYKALFAPGPDDTGGQEISQKAWKGDNVVDLGARRMDRPAHVPIAA